jgi:Tfp pilus assembly protein PilN
MRLLELDYVASPRRAHWLGFMVLALALCVAADVVIRHRDARRELSALDAAQGLLNGERSPSKALPQGRLDEEAKSVNEVVRQLTLPWAKMLAAVERASSSEVVVLQLQPEAQQRLLRLTAEARNRKAMLDYVRRLEQDRALAEVHLIRHEVRLDHPARPIQFGVQATLRETR